MPRNAPKCGFYCGVRCGENFFHGRFWKLFGLVDQLQKPIPRQPPRNELLQGGLFSSPLHPPRTLPRTDGHGRKRVGTCDQVAFTQALGLGNSQEFVKTERVVGGHDGGAVGDQDLEVPDSEADYGSGEGRLRYFTGQDKRGVKGDDDGNGKTGCGERQIVNNWQRMGRLSLVYAKFPPAA